MNTVTIAETPKGHRIWLQALESKGITQPSVDVAFFEHTIVLTFSATGKRKVTQTKGGVVDLQSRKVTAWANGATQATVEVKGNTVVLKRA